MTEEKASPRGRLIPVVAICALILAIAALYVLFRPEPTGETPFLRPRPATSTLPATTTSAPPAGTAQTAVPDPLEALVSRAVRNADEKLIKDANYYSMNDEQKRMMERMQTLQKAFWEQEDKVMASVPKYRDGKDQYRKKAETLLAGINSTDAKAVQAMSDAELAVFWDKGGLANPESYEHAYLARAILELACERSPEDFGLLCSLKEAVCATTPEHLWDFTPLPENVDDMWAVVQRQKGLFDKGKLPVSIDTLGVLDDWICLGTLHKKLDHAAIKPVCQWLIDNADVGGWSKLKKRFAVGLDDSQSVLRCREPNLYVYPLGYNLEDDCVTRAANTRRIPSFKGSPKFQSGALRVWEPWPGRDEN